MKNILLFSLIIFQLHGSEAVTGLFDEDRYYQDCQLLMDFKAGHTYDGNAITLQEVKNAIQRYKPTESPLEFNIFIAHFYANHAAFKDYHAEARERCKANIKAIRGCSLSNYKNTDDCLQRTHDIFAKFIDPILENFIANPSNVEDICEINSLVDIQRTPVNSLLLLSRAFITHKNLFRNVEPALKELNSALSHRLKNT